MFFRILIDWFLSFKILLDFFFKFLDCQKIVEFFGIRGIFHVKVTFVDPFDFSLVLTRSNLVFVNVSFY